MRLFLDTNVLLSAFGSAKGASRQIIELAALNRWHLVVTPYVISEVRKNLPHLSPAALLEWTAIQAHLLVMKDVYSIHLPAAFSVPKKPPSVVRRVGMGGRAADFGQERLSVSSRSQFLPLVDFEAGRISKA